MTETQAQTNTQVSDNAQVEQTVNYYLEAMTSHDVPSLKKAFHPDASMKWFDKGYQEVNAVEALEAYITANSPSKVRTKIMSINITGDAANAQLELEYETFYFVDFMHLLKINGEWKIVSKTYTTIQKDF